MRVAEYKQKLIELTEEFELIHGCTVGRANIRYISELGKTSVDIEILG